MQIELDSRARTQIAEAVEWYARERFSLAEDLFADLNRAIEQILARPRSFPKAGRRSRRCLLRKFPYAVVFQTKADRVVVIAFAQTSRRPVYWKQREE